MTLGTAANSSTRKARGRCKRARAEIDEEDGRAHPDGHGEDDGEGRGHQRPENGGGHPEDVVDGIKVLVGEETASRRPGWSASNC